MNEEEKGSERNYTIYSSLLMISGSHSGVHEAASLVGKYNVTVDKY